MLSRLFRRKPRRRELENAIHRWQNWWNSVGFDWYIERERDSHDEKPPFLRCDNDMYGWWLDNEGYADSELREYAPKNTR